MSCVSFFSDVSMVTGKEMAAMQSLCEKRWKHIPAELANKEIILSPIETRIFLDDISTHYAARCYNILHDARVVGASQDEVDSKLDEMTNARNLLLRLVKENSATK